MRKLPPVFVGSFLYVEAEQRHVPVLHHVILALGAHQALFLAGVHAAQIAQGLEGHDLGADEAALKVRVDLARRLGRFGAFRNGTRPRRR